MAEGGLISKEKKRGQEAQLTLGLDELVYCTPGSGSMKLTATIPSFVLDGQAGDIRYKGNDAAGVLRDKCLTKRGLSHAMQRTFFIQFPGFAGFEDIEKATSTKPGPMVDRARAGLHTKLVAENLSPFLYSASPISHGTDAIEIALEGLDLHGRRRPNYTGTSLKFRQKVKMFLQQPDRAVSEEIVFVQNGVKPPSGKLLAVVPSGHVRTHYGFFLPVSGLRRERLTAGAAGKEREILRESPTGTSPQGGIDGSIVIHNGEFLWETCDLQFPGRHRPFRLCRTYRSQVKSLQDRKNLQEKREPLGPGWYCDGVPHLDVAPLHARLWDGTGGFVDFPHDHVPPGHFVFFKQNTDLDDDTSAYQIRDPQRNEMHFNPDGSLRFVKDRYGQKTHYEYDVKGRLSRIIDSLSTAKDRWVAFAYHEEGVKVGGKEVREWVDLLKQVTDFAGRTVDFEYYAKSTGTGGVGLLKRVTYPTAMTLLEGSTTPDPAYRSYEEYEYENDATLGWRVKTVRRPNSKGQDIKWVENQYAGTRLKTQTQDGLSFELKVATPLGHRGQGSEETHYHI